MRGLNKVKGLADELTEDAFAETPTEVRMRRAPVSVEGTGEETSEDELPPATVYPKGDPRADLLPREGGYPEGWGMDLREKRQSPRPSVDDEPMSELLANFTKGAGGVADRAQAAMDGPEDAPGGRMGGFLAKASTSAAMGKAKPTPEPQESEVQQLRAQLQAPKDEPEELQELLAAQRQRGTAADLSGVSDALYSTFSRTPLRPTQQRDQVREFGEREALSTSIEAKNKKAALEDPNSAESREARAMFASTEAGKTFQKEMGPHFDRLPASKIPGSEFLIKASQRKAGAAAVDPTTQALREAQTRNLDARTSALGRPRSGKPVDPLAQKKKQLEVQKLERELGQGAPGDEKKKQAMIEVQDRYNNIKSQIAALRQQVKNKGTWEATGGHNEIMDQKITSIATDMAKLVDPTSVARETEVNAFKGMLFGPTLGKTNATAQEILGEFERMVDDRIGNAYQVRGLERPGAAPAAAPAKAAPAGKVHVSNGTENLYINPEDLAEAEAEGFKQVP